MNDQYQRNVIEAALLAAGRPLTIDELVGLFDERDGSSAESVHATLAALREEYEARGIEIMEVASGFRIQVRSSVALPVSRLWQERPAKYSRALLETLALVAYRQPITRGEIEQIRGVAVNPNIVKTLLERGWIRVIGHRDVPGKPELLGTTREFLDYFSLKKLDDLPTLAQLKELEDMRVQLSLPGAEPAVEGAAVEGAAGGTGEAGEASQAEGSSGVSVETSAVAEETSGEGTEGDVGGSDSGSDEDELDAAEAEPRTRGLVARGAGDDTD